MQERTQLTPQEKRALTKRAHEEMVQAIIASHSGPVVKPDRVVGVVDWTGYLPYVSVHGVPFGELTRRQARVEFEAMMAARPERKAELVELLRVNGVVMSEGVAGLVALDDWFFRHVDTEDSDPCQLTGLWSSVAIDSGLLLGDLAVELCPGLRWELFTRGKSYREFHYPVLTGYTNVEDRTYVNSPILGVAWYGQGVALGSVTRPGQIPEMLEYMRKLA